MPTSTPALADAHAAFATFVKALPPSTAADCVHVVTDLAQGLKAELADAITQGMPNIPLVRKTVIKACIGVTNAVIDNLDSQLAIALLTKKTGA